MKARLSCRGSRWFRARRTFRLLDGVKAGKNDNEILPAYIAEDHRLEFIKAIVDYDKGVKTEFTSARKSAIFLRSALEQALRCGICHARLHRGSIQIDHIKDKREGGRASEDNGSLSHPYCNSTFKDWKKKQPLRKPDRMKTNGTLSREFL